MVLHACQPWQADQHDDSGAPVKISADVRVHVALGLMPACLCWSCQAQQYFCGSRSITSHHAQRARIVRLLAEVLQDDVQGFCVACWSALHCCAALRLPFHVPQHSPQSQANEHQAKCGSNAVPLWKSAHTFLLQVP